MTTLIFETVHGSRAYGLARADSDVDLKGVIVGPSAWYHGFVGGPEQIEHSPDHVHFEIRKFMRLAASANPTLIEVLWTDSRHHTVVTPAGERLLDARAEFLSKRVETTFAKYAEAQLKRMATHRRWLLSPPTREPTPDAFEDRAAYKAARAQWKQYQGWLVHRNPERAAAEAAFGYDTKNAQHLVRLLRMAVEIARDGVVHVERGDRDELLAIRAGAWSYDQLVGEADRLLGAAHDAAEVSTLPDEPDREALDRLCVSLVEEVLAAGRRPAP